MRTDDRTGTGALCALLAFLAWGISPLYFHPLRAVAPLEVLAHRVTWSALLLLVAVVLLHRTAPVVAVLRDRRRLAALCGTSLLLSANWLSFIWGVTHAHLVQVSLGYFTNPLLNVALGAAFLGERLTRWQRVAVAIASVSVLFLVVAEGRIPWLAMVIGGTFALYGLFRKLLRVDPVTGLLVETWALFPVAATGLLVLHAQGRGALFTHDRRTDVLLLLAGAVTTLPLLAFVAAAQRLTLTVLGFFQYLAPSLQLLLGVILWHEPFLPRVAVAFCGIWTALAIISADAVRRARRRTVDGR